MNDDELLTKGKLALCSQTVGCINTALQIRSKLATWSRSCPIDSIHHLEKDHVISLHAIECFIA